MTRNINESVLRILSYLEKLRQIFYDWFANHLVVDTEYQQNFYVVNKSPSLDVTLQT